MTEMALPCFVCGEELRNVFDEVDNQPSEGTEFSTYGHYGSTFWDSFDGEKVVLNVCDDCLRSRTDRLGQQKAYLPVMCDDRYVGRQWVDAPMVPYCGSPDDRQVGVEPEEVGTYIDGVEWTSDAMKWASQ